MDSVKPCDDFEAMFDKELEGFYAWIRPVRAENSVRTDLVKSVQKFLDKSYAGATVKYFGSFATGLYLPEGDMDLVIVSREFLEGDYPKLGLKPGQLYKMSGQMERAGLIKPGSSNVIAHARVPLIKYADRQSGVKVDISFENLSGLNTTETCNAWRKEFPALPIMVTLVKQFLLMRDLNDVSTGGLGGFSITCLIVSLLQRNPDLAAKNSPGEIFMEFLDHYGNHFDYHKLAIELNPPRLARKVCIFYCIHYQSLTSLSHPIRQTKRSSPSKIQIELTTTFREAPTVLRSSSGLSLRHSTSSKNNCPFSVLTMFTVNEASWNLFSAETMNPTCSNGNSCSLYILRRRRRQIVGYM